MAFTIPREGEPERHPGGQSSGENSLSPLPEPTATVAQYLTTWLTEIAKPSLELSTYSYYETMARRYIVPALGMRHLDKVRPPGRPGLAGPAQHNLPVLCPRQGRCPPRTQATLLRGRSVLRIPRQPPHDPGRPQHAAHCPQPRSRLQPAGQKYRRRLHRAPGPGCAKAQRPGLDRRRGQPVPQLRPR
jgi:hypothetical protein